MNVEQFMQSVQRAVDRELERCANDLLKEAVELAPKGDTEVRERDGMTVHTGGSLSSSGYVEARHKSADERVFVVGFDTTRNTGGTFNYAIIQHEKPYHHKVGQWKFLETPYKAHKDEYKRRIMASIGSELGEVTIEGGLKYKSKGSSVFKSFDED